MSFRIKKAEQTPQEFICGYKVTNPFGDFDTGRLSICLCKAVLIFGAALGTIGSIASAFDMRVNYPLLVCAFLLLSIVMSCLHYNRVIFNIGYPVAFFLFAVSIIKNRQYANSGYQAIVNLIKSDYRDYYHLNYTGEAYEAVDNRYLAMTYAFFYLGFFLIVLLNIAISTHMSVFLTMLFTFPFLQFGLYIGKIPSVLFIVLLLFDYTAILFLKRSGHYSLSERRKKDRAFSVRGKVMSYKGYGKVMEQLLLLAFVVTVVFFLAVYPLIYVKLPGENKTSKLKAAMDSTIQVLVQSGFSSLFNRYDATGGISGGKLGGVNRVQSDYNTDLEVTFVPAGLQPVYLKAFTGAEYTGDQWNKPDYEKDWDKNSDSYLSYENDTAFMEAGRLADYVKNHPDKGQYGKMRIRNVDGDPAYLYLPYYTKNHKDMLSVVENSVVYGSSPLNQPYDLQYYPDTQVDVSRLEENTDSKRAGHPDLYESVCREIYTQVPAQVKPELEKVKSEIGEGKTQQETLQLIQNYLEKNFKYSLNPGATPPNQDFATYFLEVQKKGYCAHFATAGTLLCRAYGIPARYVEGYVIQTSDIADATLQPDENVKDWFQGKSKLEETGVVTVSVPDANAHAWTEVYLEGFGWVREDFTPPAEDEDEAFEYQSFLQLFSGLFSISQNKVEDDGTGSGEKKSGAEKFFSENSFFLLPAAAIVFTAGALFFLWHFIVYLREYLRRRDACRAGRYDEVLPYYYEKMVRTLQKKKKGIELPELPKDMFTFISSLFPEKGEDLIKTGTLFEKGIYGREQLTEEEADNVIQCILECIKEIKK